MLDNVGIKNIAQSIIKTDLSKVDIIDANEVFVEIKNGKATVGGKDIPQKLRALSLYSINAEKSDVEIRQKPVFDGLGAMIDVSRGGVMRTEKVKEFILRLALSGANRFMLYTEDIYTLEEYPHFGYLRGAYTDAELTEIKEYAENIGVTVIPCIQTLGHLAQYLSWKQETAPFRDTDSVLLCESEETYKFIEACIAKMKKIFGGDRIHIGMDETHDMGLGEYLNKNGFKDRYDLFKNHIIRVVKICEKYDLKPMMWSDMVFNLGAGAGSYYLPEVNFSEDIMKSLPEVDLVFWDYHHCEEQEYIDVINNHRLLNRPVVFAGSVRTASAPIPHFGGAYEATVTGLRACAKAEIPEVWATYWGDDGSETDYFDAIFGFATFSELCYNLDANKEDINKMGEVISKISAKLADQGNEFFFLDNIKALQWGDVFYNLTGTDFKEDKKYLDLKPVIEDCEDDYTRLMLSIMYEKADIYANMQSDYKSGKDMSVYSEEILPQILSDYEKLCEIHTERWFACNKPFGGEVLQSRYATQIHRIKYAISVVKKYVSGEIKNIEELDITPVYGQSKPGAYNFNAFTRVINYN